MKIGVDSNDGNGCGCAVALLMLVIAAVVALLTGCGPAYTERMHGMAKVDGHVYLLRHDGLDYWVHDPQCPACQKDTVVYETK